MQAEQLREILKAHRLYLNGAWGKRANLSDADLSGADLSHANLSHANLSDADLLGADLSHSDLLGANLSHANLSHANLSDADLLGADLSHSDLWRANLSDANLSGANGLFNAAKWIADHLERAHGGIYAYKTFGNQYGAPDYWVIEPGSVIAENVNPLPTLGCACGVNVATLKWCRKNNAHGLPIWRVFVKWEWMAGGVVPYNTDGKFRVPKAQLVEVVQ